MIGKLRFATIPQIAVMTLAWLAICLGIDYHFNPQLWAKNNTPPPSTVPLSLHLHHLRCKGCLEDVKKALGTLPWLQDAPMSVRVTGPDSAKGDFAGWLDITVPGRFTDRFRRARSGAPPGRLRGVAGGVRRSSPLPSRRARAPPVLPDLPG
jgi:hypothetical protein